MTYFAWISPRLVEILVAPPDRRHFVAEVHVGAGFAGVLGVVARDHSPVDDAGDGGEDRPQPAAIRFAFLDLLRIEQLEVVDAVLPPTLVKLLEANELGLFGRDDQLADHLIRDGLGVAVGPRQRVTLDTQPRLERPRLIVDARMDDAAVVPGLMLVVLGLFFDVRKLEARVAVQELAGRRQPHDAAADDGDVINHGETRFPRLLAAPPIGARKRPGRALGKTAPAWLFQHPQMPGA
jgi:hypothetical protein